MDPLSDVLSLLKPHTYVAGGFDLAGDWSIGFDAHGGIKCYALVSGGCWLAVDDIPDPIRLEAGDCILLPSGRPFRLARDLALEPTPFLALRSGEWRRGVAIVGGGGDTMILGGHFAFAGAHAEMLLDAMPPIVHLREDDDRIGLRWALERLRNELVEARPGGDLIARHLAHMMLVQALRLHLADGEGGNVGWLFALADPRMAAAIEAIHAEPGTRWTLRMLAERAGMSRSTFAQTFKASVGASPMDYVTRWRMLLAGDRLTNRNDPISTIALALGYESESAFSTAFKRVMGCAPRRYARSRSQGATGHEQAAAGPAGSSA